MKKTNSFLLLTILFLASLSSVFAQDIEEKNTNGLMWKYPAAKLPANAKTFSVSWQNSSRPHNEFIEFADLKFNQEKADVKLLLNIGNITMGSPKLYNDRSSGQVYYYFVLQGNYSIKILSPKDSIIYDKSWEMLEYSTQWYKSEYDLKAEWGVNKIPRDFPYNQVLETIQAKLKNDFVFRKWETEFTVQMVTENETAYNPLKAATLSLQKAVGEIAKSDSPIPTNTAAIDEATAKLKTELAKVDWEHKKEKFNKKIGSAILENLVIAYLTTGNYKEAQVYQDRFNDSNKGLFPDMITGRIVGESTIDIRPVSASTVFSKEKWARYNAHDVVKSFISNYNSYSKK